jgi:hypothetical protein
MSSSDNCAARENRHDPAAFGNELDLLLGQISLSERFPHRRMFLSASFS